MTGSRVRDDDGELSLPACAFGAFTDFKRTHVISVEANSTICAVLRDMEQLHIHALLVTQQARSGIDQQVLGLITHSDINRWRLSRMAHQSESELLGNARVGNVMTPWDKLQLLEYETLSRLTPRELYMLFQHTAQTHLLVVERYGDSAVAVRGLISGEIVARRINLNHHVVSH